MKQNDIKKNPFLIFLPFLLLYIAIVFIFPTHGTVGDENRYLYFAQNLINGFYSPPPPKIDLGNGPGYPIILMPFVALHLPLTCITFLNAIFYYLSVIFLFKSLHKIVSFRLTLIFSLFWACFVNVYEYLPIIYTEPFTVLLISLIIFNLLKTFNSEKKKKHIITSGFLIGYLALTKPVFGYVMMFFFIGAVLLFIVNRDSLNYKRSVVILLVSFITVSPYLIYNYRLTGKVFYWGSNGGDNLYWMSTPNKGEYGNWIGFPIERATDRIPGSNEIIKQYHQKDFETLSKYEGVERDNLFKKIAINNIKSHPIKFIQNCLSNVGRMLFNFPYSYKLEKPSTLLRLPFNGIIVVMILFCLIPTFVNWRKILFPIRFLLLFTLLYLCGSILGSVETRMFTMIVPVLLLWIAYILQKTIKIKVGFDDKDKSLEVSNAQD